MYVDTHRHIKMYVYEAADGAASPLDDHIARCDEAMVTPPLCGQFLEFQLTGELRSIRPRMCFSNLLTTIL